MANLLIIRDLSSDKKITLRDLANSINISEDGLQKIIKNGRTNTDTLEKIAEVLNVPVGVFFDETPLNTIKQNINGNRDTAASIYGNATISNCESKLEIAQKENEHLKALLEEKERSIQDKERTIQILMNKN
jgi:DNA-binding Xre family transcriptional regulator